MLPMPHSDTHRQATEYSATQLVYSIKFKLSHAISSFLPGYEKLLTIPVPRSPEGDKGGKQLGKENIMLKKEKMDKEKRENFLGGGKKAGNEGTVKRSSWA